MERALELSLGGWGRVAPNPLVGAVLLVDGEIIAEGFHREFGKPHAEAAALAACGDATGATCVVNLEPCSHHGKTRPCADKLIAAGVSRVVVAVNDPHPEAGGGAEQLLQAGIEVSVGLCSERAAALNAPFLKSQLQSERPFVALKLATSLDGFVADARGRSQWLSGPEARDYVHWLRAGFDAIAVGRRTAEADDPQLTVRGSVEPRVAPTRVILTRSGHLRPELKVVRTAGEPPTLVVSRRSACRRLETQLVNTGVTVVGADGLIEILGALRQAGLRSVLVEGGGTIATALLRAGLVDRLYWIQAPIWLGTGIPAFGEGESSLLEETARWTVTDRRALGDDTLLVVDRKVGFTN